MPMPAACWAEALRNSTSTASSSQRNTTTCHSRPFLSMMVFRPSRPDSQTSRSASMAMAIRASLGRVLNQSVKTSTGVLAGIQASHGLRQLLSAICHDQFHVQRLRKTTNFQHMKAQNGAVFVYLFHDLIV